MRKAIIFLLLLIIPAGHVHAVKRTVVEGVRYSSYDSYTRVVIDLNGPVSYKRKSLTNPDRLYIDLKGSVLSKKLEPTLSINDSVIRNVRVAQYKRNMVRIVFDLREIKSSYAFTLQNPNRLVVDVYAKKKQSAKEGVVKKKKKVLKNQFKSIKTVVIDPGHGGKDPGAIGPRGLEEKDITLSVGKKLGRILKKRHGMNVIYTRTKDTFIPLNDRTEVANENGADLFISVHVNASKRKGARGIETYFLNWTNDREAIKVAARENKVSVQKMQKVQDGLQMILQDLARKNKNEESMRLAHNIQNSLVSSLKKKYRRIEDLGVKYALFYVLVGAEMPSILVEISFISNREEERRLARESYKNRIADAIARGVDAYIKESRITVHNEEDLIEQPYSESSLYSDRESLYSAHAAEHESCCN